MLLNMQVNGNGCEDSPSRYPVLSARTPGVTPVATATPYNLPGTPTLLEEHSTMKSESCRRTCSPVGEKYSAEF